LFTDDAPRVLEGTERALALAAELGQPEPAFALHLHGLARGGDEGLEELRRALQLAVDQGLGRETAVIYGNLAAQIWGSQGPRAALDACADAIAFCERRGIADVDLQTRSSVPEFLAQLGQTQEALAEAERVAGPLSASGDMSLFDVRALKLQLLAECGSPEQARDLDELVEAARQTGLQDVIASALAPAAQMLLAQRQPERARTLLRELDELGTVHPFRLGSLLRTALALDEPALAERLAGRLDALSSIDLHAQVSASAQLAEAAGDHDAAVRLYEQAAEEWEQFGDVPERAYALLGQGRCLHALGRGEAEQPLRLACELFALLGYRPALEQTEALLHEAQAAAN
jgi:tetratricopeptide (TPR) repeat protein